MKTLTIPAILICTLLATAPVFAQGTAASTGPHEAKHMEQMEGYMKQLFMHSGHGHRSDNRSSNDTITSGYRSMVDQPLTRLPTDYGP